MTTGRGVGRGGGEGASAGPLVFMYQNFVLLWGKVKRVLGYLKGTLHMPLVLSADSLTLSRWWVDAAYAVHDDCRGHTGAGMNFGQGMALSYSWKQKINTKSSGQCGRVVRLTLKVAEVGGSCPCETQLLE